MKTEIAKMIDHSLLHPAMTDKELKEGCLLAVKYNVASVCIKPYAVKMAAGILKGTGVKTGTVVGFPHGNSLIEVKVFETEKVISDGAEEIDLVVNIGKVLSEDWDYIEKEIRSVVAATKKNNAILKVIFENDFLPGEKYKIRLCQICSKYKVDFVKTSTGYGFVKGEDGKYSYKGATVEDVELMRRYSDPKVQVKAAGGVRTLRDVLRMKDLGVTRIGASATAAIMDELTGDDSGSNSAEGY
jgi:deoxyribose-phosphate aldolase